MTGRDGRLRDFSVPPGQVSAQFLAQQNDVAHELLAPPFRALWQATREPFLQPIVDLAVPRMVFDRALLLGDAAFVPRPHTAASRSEFGRRRRNCRTMVRQYRRFQCLRQLTVVS